MLTQSLKSNFVFSIPNHFATSIATKRYTKEFVMMGHQKPTSTLMYLCEIHCSQGISKNCKKESCSKISTQKMRAKEQSLSTWIIVSYDVLQWGQRSSPINCLQHLSWSVMSLPWTTNQANILIRWGRWSCHTNATTQTDGS